MKADDLFQQTTCYLNGEKKSGKVIAVSTQVDRYRVCFQMKGEQIGKWVPDSALNGVYPTVVAKKEAKGYINPDQPKSEPQEKQDIYSETEKKDSKLDIAVETEVKHEAAKNIHALEKFVADAHLTIKNKASSDIATLVKSLKDTSDSIKLVSEVTLTALSTASEYSQLAHEWLKETIQGSVELIVYIEQTLNELWSRYWRYRIIDAIRGERLHYSKSKAVIEKLKIDYPYETDRQIAGRIISEKTIYGTVIGLLPLVASGIPLMGIVADLIVVKFLDIQGLLVEMIYQVGVSYGFDEFIEGIYLKILSLAFSRMENVFGELLKGSTPNLVIPSATNVIMFSVVGYAACEFYEAKAKGWITPTDSLSAFKASQAKIAAYSEEALMEEKTIEATVVEAISVTKQLLPIPV